MNPKKYRRIFLELKEKIKDSNRKRLSLNADERLVCQHRVMKKCSKCHEKKLCKEFYTEYNGKFGVKRHCKVCHNADRHPYATNYRQKKRDEKAQMKKDLKQAIADKDFMKANVLKERLGEITPKQMRELARPMIIQQKQDNFSSKKEPTRKQQEKKLRERLQPLMGIFVDDKFIDYMIKHPFTD